MGAKTLTQHENDIRMDLAAYILGNLDPEVDWTPDDIYRAVSRAYSDLSRFLPRELYYEQRLEFTVTNEDFTTSAAHGTYTTLANKPIRYESEVVKNTAGTVTYARNTDYVVDYMNGKITTLTGSTMVVLTAYHISYTKSKIAVDLSSLSPMRIGAVEYPAHSIPKLTVSTELFGDILTVQCDDATQSEMSLNKHILIQYFAAHTVPTLLAAGTAPSFLDDTVNQAAEAYCLFMKANRNEHEAYSDLVHAREALENMGALHTTIGARLSSAATDIIAADTALASLIAPQAAIVTALGKVTTWLTGAASASTMLAGIPGYDAAELRTGIKTALTAALTALARVHSLDGTTGDFHDAADVWTDEVKHILTQSGIPNMEDLLELGDDLINTVNIGADVAPTYAQYATVVVNMQRAWAQKRADLIAIGGARVQQAMAFMQEASIRIDNLRTYLEQARAYGMISDGFVAEANQWIGSCNIYLGEANQRSASANNYISAAGMLLYQMDRYLGEADRYNASANSSMLLADKYRTDAIEKRNEVWSIWSDKKQLTGKLADISNRQVTR